MDHLTPDVLGQLQRAVEPQYRLDGELGRGGMGVVYRATDTTLDRPVAVKVIHPELAAHEAITRRFLAEARMIARLRHPNVVAVYAAGSAGGLLYYVMDLVPGESLRERLVRDRKLPTADVARIVGDLASALDAAARAGIVHRDVKPENVLIEDASGRALLADFGIARAVAAEELGHSTGQGVAVGTPTYMSPEQSAGEEVDSRSDLYSLGVVGYEMLAGHPPFQGPNRVVVSKHIAEPPVRIDRARGDCPPQLGNVIMRALEKNPSARWQTGQEMRDALTAAATAAPRRRRRRFGVMGALAATLIVGTTVTLAGRPDGPPRGVNPRHSILVLPFDNLRRDPAMEWMRDGSVSMLGLNLSQWNDLQVVDHERLHDLLAKYQVAETRPIGLDLARRLAREAGVWTVALGEFEHAGDSLRLTARLFDVATGARVDQAEVADRPGPDVRPMFDQLAARLLDLSGAPGEIRTGLAQATTSSLEAFRRYLSGAEHLNHWDLIAAERDLRAATATDTTFGLAYYKLALTRGWLVGEKDSLADAAILRATAYSARLPAHERTVINAYRAFLDHDYAAARGLYQQLIARDSTDVDAWYGLGEAWFHDNPIAPQLAHRWSEALRAFKRTLTLDPDYALAYDHIGFLLTQAARRGTGLRLMPNDSFTLAQDGGRRTAVDGPAEAAATARAQSEAVRVARTWVATQPTTMRAHGALVDAYLAAGDYQAALGEVARYRTVPTDHPEEPFVEARIRFASGDIEQAAATLRSALDSAAPEDFRQYAGTPTVLDDIAAAANVFAYEGDLANAAKAIDFVSRVRQEVYPELGGRADGPMNEDWRQSSLAELYGAVGGPATALRRIWQSSTEAGRSAPPERRKEIVRASANAAIGLFTVTADTTPLVEMGALTGEAPGKELRALLALSRQDSTAARRALAEPDTVFGKIGYRYFRRPLAAQAHYLLGDYQEALEILRDFEPATLSSRGFDARWGMLGRVRLLRAQLHEKLGHAAEARNEYRAVLAQWRRADRSLEPFVRQAERGLARLGQQG